MKILIWGTGKRTEEYFAENYFSDCDIVAFVDNSTEKDSFYGKRVISPKEISAYYDSFDYIVIVSHYYKEILIQCIRDQIQWDKLVVVDNESEELCSGLFERLKTVEPKLYDRKKHPAIIKVMRNETDYVDNDMLIGKGRYSGWEYTTYEYFRYRTFELIARELKKKCVPGAVAELGVFRASFSALINDLFRDRKLYMFDTFEGFESKEAEFELQMGRCDEGFITGHNDTSVDIVYNLLPYPEMGIICKGFFPESVTEDAMNEKYAFVSLDVDFEESTYQGLSFFYPRMSDGGVIFVHDYNTSFLEGVRIAVKRFENDNRIKLKSIPIADRAGTLIILK